MGYIIALDLSLSCTGCSIFSDDGEFVKTCHIDTNGKEITPWRLRNIAKFLRQIKKEYKPIKIIIEKGFYRFAKSTEQVFRVHGITNLIFYNIDQIEIHATSVRKLVTGHGNINKEQLSDWIKKEYPNITFENDDEIDSYALGIAYLKQNEII